MATSSTNGPPLASSAWPTSQPGSSGPAVAAAAGLGDHRAQAGDLEPVVAVARAAVDEPVGVEQQRPVVAGERRRRLAGRPGCRRCRGPGRDGAGDRATRPAGEQQRRRVAGQPNGGPPSARLSVTVASVAKTSSGAALADEYLLDRRQDGVVVHAGQDQGPPGHPQLHAERRLVDAVAADVADHHRQPVRRGLHDVVEVAAELRLCRPGW